MKHGTCVSTVRAEKAVNAVSDAFGIEPQEVLRKDGKSVRGVLARAAVTVILRNQEEGSYPGIAKRLGGFDHTSIMNLHNKASLAQSGVAVPSVRGTEYDSNFRKRLKIASRKYRHLVETEPWCEIEL